MKYIFFIQNKIVLMSLLDQKVCIFIAATYISNFWRKE